ncbi:hypothetical protein DFH94DRAFT_797571 [Russula ochroleuca]|uniref:Uncharacterized protein n=1 Tax=Russula ochroleuca TaxID=152965 RepID=A0A9P5N5Q3_9AGAM|nr:hypothetical protein DFH94DRAFT_797571 [Russula ochroleuca]
MPLSLPLLNFAIICEGNELETYDIKQEGPNSTRAFVASVPSAGRQRQIIGMQKTATSVLPFNFQELELVACCLFFSFVNKDPDLESAPVVPEMGMIELQTFRSVPKGERWWQWPNGCGHKCANAAKERTQRRKHPKQGYSVSENQKRVTNARANAAFAIRNAEVRDSEIRVFCPPLSTAQTEPGMVTWLKFSKVVAVVVNL